MTFNLVAVARISNRKSLDDTIPGEHATINGEVAAHHKSSHCSILLSQLVGLVGLISLVLAAIDQDQTGEAGAATADLEHGIVPTTALAETWVQH